jgi:hypothetical protein
MNLFEVIPMENILVWVHKELYCNEDVKPTIYDGDNPESLSNYIIALQELINYLKCSIHTLLITLIYAQRLAKSGLKIGDQNVKRVLLACFCIAMKYHDDGSVTNKSLSHLTGMKNKDMSALEIATLIRLDYMVHVTIEEWLENLNELIYESRIEN